MNKRVLVRLDLDVPLHQTAAGSEVEDVTRLQAAVATLNYLLTHQATVIILGHAGRPQGADDDQFSLRPILSKLMELLENKYTYQVIDTPIHVAHEGTIYALENLRFNPGEEGNDPDYAQWLASFGEMYVNDAFAVSHRAHASIVGVPRYLPSYAGLHLQTEVEHLQRAVTDPPHPVAVVLGGAKVETKLPAIQFMSKIADQILLGGKLVLEAGPQQLPSNAVLPSDMHDTFDLGPEAIQQYTTLLAAAQTIIWNGPMGKFEEAAYETGTRAVAEAIAANTTAQRVIGGGDTLEALRRFSLLNQAGYISTGGGAMLDFLAGEQLPGLAALGLYES